MELWVGCIAGALEEGEYAAKLRAAGFAGVEVETWRIYERHGGAFASAFVRGRKPLAKMSKTSKACCAPGVLLLA